MVRVLFVYSHGLFLWSDVGLSLGLRAWRHHDYRMVGYASLCWGGVGCCKCLSQYSAPQNSLLCGSASHVHPSLESVVVQQAVRCPLGQIT